MEGTKLTRFEYDLLSVGGGPAGLVGAVGASHLGLKPALIEKERLGGDCLWTGCVPSKSLLASSHLSHAIKHASDMGLEEVDPIHDSSIVMKRMRNIRSKIAIHDNPHRLLEMGIDTHFGHARFKDPTTLEVEGVGIFKSKRIILATGAKPKIPDIKGLDKITYLTYENIFDLEKYPDSIGIIGAGPVGVELAQTFNRLGSQVAIFEIKDGILNREDDDVGICMKNILQAEGIQIHLESTIQQIIVDDKGRNVVSTGKDHFQFDDILLATGREPAIQDLNLEVANVEINNGIVKSGPTLVTSNKRIWAVGDASGGPQFTHYAEYSAATAVRNSLLPFPKSVEYSFIPHVIFTDPEIAHVGLTEQEATSKGGKTFRVDFEEIDRAMAEGKTEGFIKISANKKGHILGCSIIGYRGGELIQPVVIAMKHGLTLPQIASTTFAYPTMGEGLKRSAMAYQKSRLESPLGLILKKCVAWIK